MFLNLLSHLPWEQLQKKLLIKAIKEHNLDYIKSYIKKGYPVNFKENSILHYVLKHNSTSIFKFLLKQEGLDINLINEEGNTILAEVIIHNKFKYLDYLLKSNYAKQLDFTASCIVKNNTEKYPLGQFSCQTFIFYHIKNYVQQYGIVKLLNLVRLCVMNFNIPDNQGNLPLVYIIQNKQPELFNYVLSKTQNMYQINNKKENLLHTAFSSGHIEFVERLIDYNFDILAMNTENKSYEDFVADLKYENKTNQSTIEQLFILIENKINFIQEEIKKRDSNFITNDSHILPLKKIV